VLPVKEKLPSSPETVDWPDLISLTVAPEIGDPFKSKIFPLTFSLGRTKKLIGILNA
jgi:hypothetical protein